MDTIKTKMFNFCEELYSCKKYVHKFTLYNFSKLLPTIKWLITYNYMHIELFKNEQIISLFTLVITI